MEMFIQILIYSLIILGFVFNLWLSILNYKNRNAEIPKEVEDVYEPKKYKKWLEYTMEQFRFNNIVKVINLILFLAMLLFGVFVLFDDIAISISNDSRLQVLIFLALYNVITFIVQIFVSYYHTFVIEEKYGFNKTTKKTFIIDKIKNIVLTAVFGGGLVYLVLVIYDSAGNLFLLYTWIAVMVIFLIVNIIYVPLIVPIFNKLTPLEEGELQTEINKFAKSVGYEVSKISVINASKRSTKLNAYFTGFGKFKKIVLYDTLIEKMSTEEIVAVLAHEIGHNKYKHIIYNIFQMAITLLIYIGVFALVLGNDVFSTAFGFDSVNFGFSLMLLGVLLEPISIIINLVTAFLSRKHEYQADNFAATKFSSEHIINALKVLAKENFANLTPHPLYVKLTYSHPPIVDRIRAIRKVENNG